MEGRGRLFNVTVTDGIGCSLTNSVAVSQPLPVTASVVVNNNVSCNGGGNGNASVIASGGNSGYTYLWMPGGSLSQNPSNLASGQYIITVTDSKGCFQTTQTTITQPAVLSSGLTGVTNVNCFGGATGSATVTGIGGTPNYSYQWTPSGATSAIASNLAAGIHTVVVTDANFCTTQYLVTISQPALLTATVSLVNSVSCNGGNNGSAIVNQSGGTAPYSYSWNTAPTQTTQLVSNLPAGNYAATVVDSKNCLVTTSAVTISQPTALTVTVNPSALVSCSTAISISAAASGGTGSYGYLWSNGSAAPTINVYTGSYTVTVTDNLGCSASASVSVQAANNFLTANIPQPANICNGATTSVSVTASGGFGSYTYLWDNGSTSSSVVVLAGAHCVDVTDGGGCIVSACVNVIQNQPIIATIAPPPFICPTATTVISASVSGGQAPYTYLWNNGVTTSTAAVVAGIYTVTISDVTGSSCSNSATTSVITETPITIITGSTNVSCNGGNNGTASIYVSGGIPNYSYLWSVNGATTSIVGNLSSGNYSVQVTDNIGCKKSANIIISQPTSSVTAVVSGTNITCNAAGNGIAVANGSGGAQPYYFYWDPSGVSTPTLTNLVAGTYTVLVADSTGCVNSTTISITEPSPITISSSTIASTCGQSNASATVTPTGGGGVYTYTWNPTGGNNSTISNVFGGTYTLSVLDNLGCLKLFSILMPQVISTASPSFSINTVCPNTPSQFADLSINGNDSITSWSWDFNDPLSGGNNFSFVQNPSHVFMLNGTYSPTLTVTTLLGCSKTFSLSVPFYPVPNAAFLLNSTCANASMSFTNTSTIATGSIINYNWNFGDIGSGTNNTSNVLNPVHYYSGPGIYTTSLTAISNNNCTALVTHTINIYPLPAASFTASNVCENTPAQFSNLSSGSFVKWIWDYGDMSPLDSTTMNPSHLYLTTGSYSVILTTISSNNCKNYDTLQVSAYPSPVVNFNAPSVCLNKPTSFTDLSYVSSGSISSWNWDFGNFSQPNTTYNPIYTFATFGVYNVNYTVTTSNGCSAVITKTVGVYDLPVANFSESNACLNVITQFTDASTTGGGTTIQTWLWAFGDGSPINATQNPGHTYALTGVYNPTLVVTNNFGCKDTVTKTLTIYPYPVVSFSIEDTSGCATFCPKFTDTSTPAGILNSWQWNFGDNGSVSFDQNPVHCFTSTGTYSISLQGSTINGCTGSSAQNSAITIHPVPVASFTFTPINATTSNPEIQFTNTSVNATSWLWNFGDETTSQSTANNPVHAYENAGEYCAYLKAVNRFGCTSFARECLTIEADFTFYVPNAFTPGSTNGINDFFTGYGTNIDKFNMLIFDRWGEQIFQTSDIYKGWDGTAKGGKNPGKQDVYTYKIEVTDFRGNVHKYVGHVTLLK